MKGRHTGWGRWLGILVCALALIGSSVACEKTPREKLLQAKTNLARETNSKQTKRLLKEVLDAEPKNLQAKRLLAQVFQMEGKYKRAEDKLEAIWDEHEFGDQDAQLSTDLRSARERVRDDFVDLYKTWAENLDPKKRSDRYIATVEKGIEYDNKDMDLNAMAVDFYWNKGQRLVEAGKKKEAARTFEQIVEMRTRRGDNRREQAKKKARDLRLEFFKDAGRKRFEKVGAATLSETEGLTLSEDGETIRIDLVQDVDRQLKPDKEKHAAKAKQIAFIGLIEKLRRLTLAIADLPDDADLSIIGNEEAKRILLSKLDFDNTNFQRGQYTIEGTLPLEKAIGMAYDIKQAWKKAKQADQKAADGADNADGATEDGGEAEGDTAGAERDASADEQQQNPTDRGGDQP